MNPKHMIPLQTSCLVVLALLSLPLFSATNVRAAESDEGIALLLGVLGDTDDPQLQLEILKGVNAALEGRPHVDAPEQWKQVRQKLANVTDAQVRAQLQSLGAVFGDESALAALRTVAGNSALSAEERRKAIDSLIRANDPNLASLLVPLLNDPAVREASLAGLAASNDPRSAQAIIAAYASFDLPARRAALNALASRVAFAQALADAVNQKKIPPGDLTAATARQLRDLDDSGINAFVAQHWGVARVTPQEKAQEIARRKQMLLAPKLVAPDPSRGRAVFARTCAQCHTLYGEGGKVGPDLTGSNRADLDYILQNVVDPSAVIAKDYQVTTIRTKDKRILTGIAHDGEHAIRVTSETGEVIVPKNQIDRMKLSDLSMMPEGLLNGLSENEVEDLVAYLQTARQTPLPATAPSAAK